jgi:hypothetical protein
MDMSLYIKNLALITLFCFQVPALKMSHIILHVQYRQLLIHVVSVTTTLSLELVSYGVNAI